MKPSCQKRKVEWIRSEDVDGFWKKKKSCTWKDAFVRKALGFGYDLLKSAKALCLNMPIQAANLLPLLIWDELQSSQRDLTLITRQTAQWLLTDYFISFPALLSLSHSLSKTDTVGKTHLFWKGNSQHSVWAFVCLVLVPEVQFCKVVRHSPLDKAIMVHVASGQTRVVAWTTVVINLSQRVMRVVTGGTILLFPDSDRKMARRWPNADW